MADDREPYQRPALTPGVRLAEITMRWGPIGLATEPQPAEWWHDQASRDVPWLIAEVGRLRQRDYVGLVALRDLKRLRGLLRDLEWAGGEDGWPRCPACGASAPGNHPTEPHLDGHAPGCWLAAELHG